MEKSNKKVRGGAYAGDRYHMAGKFGRIKFGGLALNICELHLPD